MNNEIFEKYKNEMLKMYEQAKKNSGYVPAQAEPMTSQMQREFNQSITPDIAQTPLENNALNSAEKSLPQQTVKTSPQPQNSKNGGILGIVTSFRSLYPVENAKVTVFTGDVDNMNVIDSDVTDRSGRTKVFSLPAPDKSLSMSPDLAETPYSLYNIAVYADGFLHNIHLNIPVFSGITSIQRSDMILSEDKIDKTPQIFDESQKYNL